MRHGEMSGKMTFPVHRGEFQSRGAMFARRAFLLVGSSLICAAFLASRGASQSSPAAPAAPPQAGASSQTGSGQSGYVLKVTTRLVTLDVVVTDSHGTPVRDLK